MAYAIQWLRSLLFNAQMYVIMPIWGLAFFPWALVDQRGAFACCKSFSRYIRWTASWMIGLKVEIRGTPPSFNALVAAKHQSFLDVMMIFTALPRGKFIMKKLLKYAPVIGQYAVRLNCVMVDRGKRGAAIQKMIEDVRAGHADGQLIIYPQGTRIAPGVKAPYKVGTAVLYHQLGQPCVPVAASVGVFWPKRGIYRKPGTAVIEFLEPIPPGLPKDEFLKKLEYEVESHSNRLMAEAGFHADNH
ncbi:MAG: lysophospholipid acyltransferase family protein [Pseudomonadota bacterium]